MVRLKVDNLEVYLKSEVKDIATHVKISATAEIVLDSEWPKRMVRAMVRKNTAKIVDFNPFFLLPHFSKHVFLLKAVTSGYYQKH